MVIPFCAVLGSVIVLALEHPEKVEFKAPVKLYVLGIVILSNDEHPIKVLCIVAVAPNVEGRVKSYKFLQELNAEVIFVQAENPF